MSVSYEQLKSQVSTFRNKVATEQARLEQAEKREQEIAQQIQKDYGVDPENLDAELKKTEAEVQETATKIMELTNQA